MKNVFKHYAGCDATSEAVTLNLDEFTMLCTDTKLRLDTTAVRRIFAECCEPNSDVRGGGGEGEGGWHTRGRACAVVGCGWLTVWDGRVQGGVDPDLAEIGPSECMEALIRIAIEKYGRVRCQHCLSSRGSWPAADDEVLVPMSNLQELSYVGAALQRVFEHHILPHARQTDANHWRQTLQRPALRALLTKYSTVIAPMGRLVVEA